jgi:hypothetical protein
VIAQSVERWATDWTIGVLRFDSQRGLGIFLFTTAARPALGPTQPPIQWVPGALSFGVKRPGCEADHSPSSSAEVKNGWSYTSTKSYVFMVWYLVKHRNNFAFYVKFQGFTPPPPPKMRRRVNTLPTIRGCIQKFPDLIDNEINNNNKHSLRSNTKGYGAKTH